MITTTSRIEDKKQLGLILPKDTMETFLCVQDAPCITQEFALSSVGLATKRSIGTRCQGSLDDVLIALLKIYVHHVLGNLFMSVDSAVTYTSVHSEARSWSIPSEDPYEEATRYADNPGLTRPPRKRLLLTTPRPGCEIGESSAAAARQPGPTIETRLRDTERRMMTTLELVNRRVTYQVDVCTRESSEFCTRHHDAQKDRTSVRAEIESTITVLETEAVATRAAQAADDLAVQHIMRTQALEAGSRVDTLEDTGSSS
ncbi:hypothetical protein Tco_0006459 [Tanacetum coccineum]